MVEETNDKMEGDSPMKKLDPECFSIHYLICKILSTNLYVTCGRASI